MRTLARPKLEPGGLVVADNVLSHAETLAAYSAARQADPSLSSVTVPLDRGLELTPPGAELCVLPTYTAMLGLRGIVADRGYVKPYWERAA